VDKIAKSLGRRISWDKPGRASYDSTEELISRNMFQIAPNRNPEVLAARAKKLDVVLANRDEMEALRVENLRKRGFPDTNPWEILNNVYSGNSKNEFLASLTNRTNDLPRVPKTNGATSSYEHGNISERFPVVFKGKVYPSAEHAYVASNVSSEKAETVSDEEIRIMTEVITEKLRQHPALLTKIQAKMSKLGADTTGTQWADILVHWTKSGGRWEGNGLESPFLRALGAAIDAAIASPESAEDPRLIRWIQDKSNQVSLPKQGAVNIPPNAFGDVAVQPVTGSDNIRAGASGEQMDTPEGLTTKLMQEFAKMRETAARQSTLGAKIDGFEGLDPRQKTNLYRTLGASGPYGFRFDSLNPEPIPGVSPARTIRARINAIAARMGVSLPPELNFAPGKPIIGDRKTVAQVMADMFMAIRYMNTVEGQGGISFDGETRAEMAAIMLEMSRTLHEVGDPYSLAMIKGLSKTSSSGQYLGLTAKAKEIAALGVDMINDEDAPEIRGRKTGSRLRQLASAQVGMAPESSPRATEAKMWRTLELDLAPVSKKSAFKTRTVARAGESNGIPSITTDNAIYDIQKVVDEVGIWDVAHGGGDDTASIDIDGFVEGVGGETFSRTLKSPISDLLGVDEAMDLIRRYTSVKKLDDRGDFSLFNYRTGFKYRSRLGEQGVMGGDQQIEAPKVERVKVDKPNVATQAESLRRRIDNIRSSIDSMDRYAAGVLIWTDDANATGAVRPVPELETYRAMPSGVGGKRIAFLRQKAVDAIKILSRQLDALIGSSGTDSISLGLTEYESDYQAELATKFGEGGAYAEMYGVESVTKMVTEAINGRGWRGLIVAGEKAQKVKLPQQYLEKRRAAYAKWKGIFDEVAQVHGRDYATAYMSSEEGRTLYGEEPPKFEQDYITLEPGEYMLPEPIARAVASNNQGIIIDVEMNELGGPSIDETQPVDIGVDLAPSKTPFKLLIRPIVSSKYLVLKNGTVVANRSSETGFIQHRKVYPFRVERIDGGGYRVVRLDGYQFQHTDPNQVYDNEALKDTLSKLDEAFPGTSEDTRATAFESNQATALLSELNTSIALDGYSSLEILAINGDIFPSLEAEIISSITEADGFFRVSKAPNWTKSRAGGAIHTISMTPAEKALTKVSANPEESLIGQADVAKVGKMQSSVEPSGMLAGQPAYKITTYPDWLVEASGGEVDKTEITVGTQQGSQRYSGSIQGQTLTRDQALALTSPSTTSIQKAIGGAYTVHDIVASPELFGHTVKTETMDGDSGAMYIVRALTYMLRLSEEAVVQMGYGSRFSKMDLERYGLTEPAIMLVDKSTAIEAARIGGDTYETLVRESLDAARLAAMSLTEAAKGTLRKSWSDSLDPKYHRHEFPLRTEVVTPLQESMYPIYRLLEPATVTREGAEAVTTVIEGVARGNFVDLARVSGALGDKATAFYTAFYAPAGLPDPKTLAGMPAAELNQKAEYYISLIISEASRHLGVDLRVPVVPIQERFKIWDEEKGIAVEPEVKVKSFVAALYEVVKEANPREILSWEQGQGGFSGQEGMMQITKPDGTVEVVSAAEWRAQAKSRKMARAVDGFDATTGLDSEGMVVEFDINSEFDYADSFDEGAEPVDGVKMGKASSSGFKFAKAVAVRYNSNGDIQAAIRETLPDFTDIPELGTAEMKMFFRNFWKTLSVEMSGKMVGPAIERVIRTMIETQDGKTKLANSQRIWVQDTDSPVDGPGITITSQAGEGVPSSVPAPEGGYRTINKTATIQLNDQGKLEVNTEHLLSLLEGRLQDNGKYSGGLDRLAAKTDTSLRQQAWEAIRQYLNGPESLKAPYDWGTPGPTMISIKRVIETIKTGRIPFVAIDPPTDTPLNIRYDGGSTGKRKKQSTSGEDVVDPNDYEHLQDSYAGRDSEDLSGGYTDTDSEIMDLSVKQGKLLGLLQPDQLVPKFGPGLKSLDVGLRTPKGNFAGGFGADVGIMALQGNLSPESALFSGALNSVNLLTKSPWKAGLIGSVAGLAATAATGGDIGRTMFGIVGSILGGGIGAFASGGIGTFVGSTAGSLAADELWKGLFGSNEGMRPTVQPIIPTVRIP
jgi:hypothetical protein